jgi:tetratricopeptide (TPR) repeat protein
VTSRAPLRLPYRIDEDANREVVDETVASAYLARLADCNDLSSRGQRVATLRMLGRLDEAEREGRTAYALALREGTPRQQLTALLRLGHVMQFRREWVTADAMFAEAFVRARDLGDPLMLAFVYQHAGRNHIDQGRYELATAAFRDALTLREAHGAPADAVESSRAALQAAKRRLAQYGGRR